MQNLRQLTVRIQILVLLCFALPLKQINAQLKNNKQNNSKTYKGFDRISGYDNSGEFKYVSLNMDAHDVFVKLFMDSIAYSHEKFKKITINTFYSNDSLRKDRRKGEKQTFIFNANGDLSSFSETSDSGKITDSISNMYDAGHNAIRRIRYKRRQMDNKIGLTDDHYYTRNTSGKLIRDSLFSCEFSYKGSIDTSIYIHKYFYDNAGNKARTVKINLKGIDSDTTVTVFKYDNKNREIFYKSQEYSIAYKYDNASNIIEEVRISEAEDTSRTLYTYDDNNKETKKMKYKNGTLVLKETTEYITNGGSVKTSETYENNKDKEGSCESTKKEVAITDKYYNPLSDVITQVSAGETTTITAAHQYKYIMDGKIVSDSQITVMASQWTSLRTLSISLNKYDERGNLIESESMGDLFKSNPVPKRKCTYNDKNKPLEINSYSTCSDKPESQHIFTYYPDGVTIKEETTISMYGTMTIKTYGKDTRLLEVKEISKGGDVTQRLIEYME